MANPQAGVWGIDLGLCALKAIRLTIRDDQVVATAFDFIEHPKMLSQPDADANQLTREALEAFLSRNKIRGDSIAISVPGATGLARFVKLPPVEAKKVPDIVKFEAKQQIPFPLDEVVWDWQTLESTVITEGFVENEIGLFAMKRDVINRYLQAFIDVKVEVDLIQMSPLSLCNYAVYDLIRKGGPDGQPLSGAEPERDEEGKKKAVAVMDIGADSTNLVISDGARIIWQRPIPLGGSHFTRALTRDMKLTFAKAEHLKRNATKASDPKKIFQSMKPVFTDFLGELQRSLGFFASTHRDAKITELLGLGNGFRLPGLQKFLAQSLGMEIAKLDEFKRMKTSDALKSPVYTENIMSFGVAYGLAIQGLKHSKLTTNLLPPELLLEREVRRKKPWAVAAAASLLAGVVLVAYPSSREYLEAQEAKKESENVKNLERMREEYKRKFDTELTRLRDTIEKTASLVRGRSEMLNQALLHRFISRCVPQPSGENLTPAARKFYWESENYGQKAKTAYEVLSRRDGKGEKDNIESEHLLQINIQAVYSRYCDVNPNGNVPLQWATNVKRTMNVQPSKGFEFDGDTVKPPTKAGWAVEIHGYTYHLGGVRFVRETLLANLRPAAKNYEMQVPANEPHGWKESLEISHAEFYKINSIPIIRGAAPAFKFINNRVWSNELIRIPPLATGAPGQPAPAPAPAPGQQATPAGGGINPKEWAGNGRALRGPVQTTLQGNPDKPIVNEPPTEEPVQVDPLKPVKISQGQRLLTEFVVVFFWVENRPSEAIPAVAPTPGQPGQPGQPGKP